MFCVVSSSGHCIFWLHEFCTVLRYPVVVPAGGIVLVLYPACEADDMKFASAGSGAHIKLFRPNLCT